MDIFRKEIEWGEIMAFFKTEEEKKLEEEIKLKEAEEYILTKKRFHGKVGQIHQGLSTFGLWGVRDNGKTKFKSTTFEIHDDKILIQRNKNIIHLSQIKEIFYEVSEFSPYPYEAIIILNNDTGIPIRGGGSSRSRDLLAFINVLNKLLEDYKSDPNNIESNEGNNTGSEDKVSKLIKLGEMYEKGLLSDDEFALMKKELIEGSTEETSDTSEDNIETSEIACENCGAEISEDDVFCSECGTQIN